MERVLENDIVGQLFESRFSQYSENYVKQNNNLEDMELERNKLLSLINRVE